MKSEKRKDNKFLLAIVAVALLGVSIGYAIISTGYNIEGTVNVGANTWNITSGAATQIVNDGATDVTAPVVNTDEPNQVEVTYSVKLETPGDSYSFVIPITNKGSIDAIMDGFETKGLEAYGKSVKYTVEELTSETATEGTEVTDKSEIVLAKAAGETGTTKYFRITVKYVDDNDSIAATDINGGKITTTFNFKQNRA